MLVEGAKKILRLPEDYGKTKPIPGDFIGSDNWHKNVISIFRKSGYKIIKGGEFDPKNLAEIGYYLPAQEGEDGKPTERLAHASGAKIPERLIIDNILDTSKPIMAKATFLDRGLGKFLLETEEQKVRFMAWAAVQGLGLYMNMVQAKSDQFLGSVIDMIKHGQTIESKDMKLWGWILEEYIETPSRYHTSFRLLVDAHGITHYSTLLRSAAPKGMEDRITDWESYLDETPEVNQIRKLVTPGSPVFLNSRHVVSNFVQGGQRNILDGQRIIDPLSREVVADHGINPDKPEVPDGMKHTAAKIGITNRQHTPYSGEDFVMNKSLKELFIEANSMPMLSAIGLGLPDRSTERRCHIVLTERIAQYLP